MNPTCLTAAEDRGSGGSQQSPLARRTEGPGPAPTPDIAHLLSFRLPPEEKGQSGTQPATMSVPRAANGTDERSKERARREAILQSLKLEPKMILYPRPKLPGSFVVKLSVRTVVQITRSSYEIGRKWSYHIDDQNYGLTGAVREYAAEKMAPIEKAYGTTVDTIERVVERPFEGGLRALDRNLFNMMAPTSPYGG